MRLFKIVIVAMVALFSTTHVAEAQQSARYTLGDISNNEVTDTIDFDLNAPYSPREMVSFTTFARSTSTA